MNWLSLLTGTAPVIPIPEGRKHECEDEPDTAQDGECPDAELAEARLNRTYGRLRVLTRSLTDKGRATWWARCECGVEKTYYAFQLRKGAAKSCGCAKYAHLEAMRERKKMIAEQRKLETAEERAARKAAYQAREQLRIKLRNQKRSAERRKRREERARA